MGYWGYKLFESDHDMELLGEVLQDSAEMLGYEEKLSDSGAFHLALSSNRGQGLGRMIDKYEKDPEKTGSGRDHKIILLVAYAMERGVQYLDNDFRQKVRAKNEKLGITKEARAQMREALDKFKPCKPWKFESLGLQDTIAKFEAERRAKGIPEE